MPRHALYLLTGFSTSTDLHNNLFIRVFIKIFICSQNVIEKGFFYDLVVSLGNVFEMLMISAL